ncbi:MAG TPA: ABC transporter ATP-binding protein [Jatrophihabitantaceae bacterium]|jgi:molybdate transport system ATP-binding protein|nr:ABC transporter ATP-binding protein [Jatrophihabitantaceae bacterium]
MSSGLLFDGRVERGAFVLEAELRAYPREVLAVMGPNGAGKSTLLRSVAGLIPLTHGRILLGDQVLDDAASGRFREPADRRLGLVFQDGRLFAHLPVVDNVGYGLRSRGADRRTARRSALHWLGRFGIEELAGRRPRDLSGGQAQRVALARALASEPEGLLLDEPFAALDAQTRADVQAEMKRHLAGFAGPAVLVTHDAIEALVLADRLVVIEAGRIVQHATPAEITSRPATPYVAKLVGMNLYAGRARGTMVELAGGGTLTVAEPVGRGQEVGGIQVLVALRPSAVTLHATRPAATSARNVWAGRVGAVSAVGDRIRLEVAGRPPALVDVTVAAVTELGLGPGSPVWLSAKATDLTAYPARI